VSGLKKAFQSQRAAADGTLKSFMSLVATSKEEPSTHVSTGCIENSSSGSITIGLESAAQPLPPVAKNTLSMERTLEGIRRGLQLRETAFVAQIIELVREVSVKIETLSVHQLAEIIGRDLTTTARLMKTACTVGFNPDGVEIASINEAIQVIGYNRIRNMAVSLLLLQNANRKWSHDEFDDVSSVMLTSSLMAETLATSGGRRMDADHIFLSAALRNYGKLLAASFFPDEYRTMLKLIPERGEDSAFLDQFGMTGLDIADEALRQAKLPPSLLRCLERVNPKIFESEDPPTRQEEQLLLIDFSVKFCELLARLKSADEFTDGYARLLRNYGRVLSCTKEDMKRLLEDTQAKIETFRRSIPSPLFANRVVQNIRALLEDQPLVPKPDVDRPRSARPDDDPATYVHSPERSLRLGLRDLERLLEQESVEEGVAWSLATRLLCRSLELENAMLLRRQATQTAFHVECGFGSADFGLKDHGRVLASDKTIFSVGLKNSRDVIIQRPQDPAIQPFVPGWLKPLATGALLILPIADDSGTFALLTGIARPDRTFMLSPKTMEHLTTLKRQLAKIRSSDPGPRQA
jgi:HD-like signal output (HDOD) protein